MILVTLEYCLVVLDVCLEAAVLNFSQLHGKKLVRFCPLHDYERSMEGLDLVGPSRP